jgi:hypothetical protein
MATNEKRGKLLAGLWRVAAESDDGFLVAPTKADANDPAHLALRFDKDTSDTRGVPLPFGSFFKFNPGCWWSADPDPLLAEELMSIVDKPTQQRMLDSLEVRPRED